MTSGGVQFYSGYALLLTLTFLYPNQRTGYLMMEYIEGVSIDRCEPVQMGESWNKIFEEAISAFRNIESLGMLHRDVRPNNFLIDNEGSLKVIDFGFGKQLTENSTEGTSIFLNWPASNPDEVLEGRYTHASEIYYLGKMFSSLKSLREDPSFSYWTVLEKMTERNPVNRYSSFFDVEKAVQNQHGLDFSDAQKDLYLAVAEVLEKSLDKIEGRSVVMRTPQEVSARMRSLVAHSSLEYCLQDVSLLISCFIRNSYTYYRNRNDCRMSDLRAFLNFFSEIGEEGRSAVLNGISIRLRNIELVSEESDIPF